MDCWKAARECHVGGDVALCSISALPNHWSKCRLALKFLLCSISSLKWLKPGTCCTLADSPALQDHCCTFLNPRAAKKPRKIRRNSSSLATWPAIYLGTRKFFSMGDKLASAREHTGSNTFCLAKRRLFPSNTSYYALGRRGTDSTRFTQYETRLKDTGVRASQNSINKVDQFSFWLSQE